MLKMNLITQEELWGGFYRELDRELGWEVYDGLYEELYWELFDELYGEVYREVYGALGFQILTDFRGYNTVCYK
jgi:hypothetical protein